MSFYNFIVYKKKFNILSKITDPNIDKFFYLTFNKANVIFYNKYLGFYHSKKINKYNSGGWI